MRKFCISFIICFSCIAMTFGQPNPIAQWDFKSSDRTQTSGKYSFYLEKGDEIRDEDGIDGQYLVIGGQNPSPYRIKDLPISRGITLEFWARIPSDKLSGKMRLFRLSDNSLAVGFRYPKITFLTSLYTDKGEKIEDRMGIDLDGVDRESFQYFLDNQWHHWVIKYDPQKGKKEIWIDGKLPDSFSKKLEVKGSFCKQNSCIKGLIFSNSAKAGDGFVGAIDQIKLYDRFIPDEVHLGHFEAGAKSRPTPPKTNKDRSIPQVTESSILIDLQEFPPAHPTVQLTALEQLQAFPLPRYKPVHSLRRLYNWMEPVYLGGHKSHGVSGPQSILNSANIQEELAMNWHYTIIIHNALTGRSGKNGYVNAWIEVANRHPDIPLGVTTLWAQTIHTPPKVKPKREANIKSQLLEPEAYLRNAKGQPIDQKGRPNPRKKRISPIMPDHYIIEDGRMQGQYLKTIQKQLTRPINIINENGEVPFAGTDSSVLALDPDIVKDKSQLGIDDWTIYQAVKKTHQRSLYRDAMIKEAGLEEIRFSWYGVDGGPTRHVWTYGKKIHTPTGGQYFSTPDFYPRWPDNWYKWAGAWRGWAWMEECRQVELADNDLLFSPFVAAGWHHNPERNIRPSQYLGLLKNLGVIGAEFFYPGFFNVKKTIANPQNYIWQAAYPAYAQAITSRYEEILRNGNVLMDANGQAIIRLETSNPNVLATVRKHNEKDIYIIGTTLQPLSNQKGQVPDEMDIDVDLQTERIRVRARRQGSIYYYDRTDPAHPVFYQLDTWHESGHPWHWSKDFTFDAEVYDLAQEISIGTETAKRDGDFTQFTSYIEADGEDACAKFYFVPRSKNHASFEVRFRARRTGNGAAHIEALLDSGSITEEVKITSDEWTWYALKKNWKDLQIDTHLLTVHLSSGVQLDQIQLHVIP